MEKIFTEIFLKKKNKDLKKGILPTFGNSVAKFFCIYFDYIKHFPSNHKSTVKFSWHYMAEPGLVC